MSLFDDQSADFREPPPPPPFNGRTSLKATFHSTIFDIPMRPVHEDQRNRRRFSRQRRPATPVLEINPLNFARFTLPTHPSTA